MADSAGPFTIDQGKHCALLFLARRLESRGERPSSKRILALLDDLQRAGWRLSVHDMMASSDAAPSVYDTSAVSDIDVAGIFEAPSLDAALEGIGQLEAVGWGQLYDTEWIIGIREFSPVGTPNPDAPWGFIALWEWNDAWCAASAAERATYDAGCDVAFRADLAAGICISGRHRSDLASRWHHFAAWDVPSLAALTSAMADHETASDFRFTLSRHYLGRRVPLPTLLEATGV